MYSCSFIFRPGTYDKEFHRLDDSIEAYAVSLEGYLGVDRWISADGLVNNSIYYWRDMASVSLFARFPDHLEAKKNYARWYEGYQIVISEVTASYGDGAIHHISASAQ